MSNMYGIEQVQPDASKREERKETHVVFLICRQTSRANALMSEGPMIRSLGSSIRIPRPVKCEL